MRSRHQQGRTGCWLWRPAASAAVAGACKRSTASAAPQAQLRFVAVHSTRPAANLHSLCLPCRSDPTHFLLILAYLRDSRVPPLPQTALELRQLEAEASYYAMAELADAAASAAAPLEAAAAAARQLERRRAEAVQAADAALERAQAEVAAVEALPEMQQLREAQRKRDSLRERSDEDAELIDEWFEAHQAVEYLEVDHNMQLPLLKEKDAARQLRDALLARLCALGADMPAVQAQLRATHPDLANRNLD